MNTRQTRRHHPSRRACASSGLSDFIQRPQRTPFSRRGTCTWSTRDPPQNGTSARMQLPVPGPERMGHWSMTWLAQLDALLYHHGLDLVLLVVWDARAGCLAMHPLLHSPLSLGTGQVPRFCIKDRCSSTTDGGQSLPTRCWGALQCRHSTCALPWCLSSEITRETAHAPEFCQRSGMNLGFTKS